MCALIPAWISGDTFLEWFLFLSPGVFQGSNTDQWTDWEMFCIQNYLTSTYEPFVLGWLIYVNYNVETKSLSVYFGS